ncbi:uncharacterized protein NKAPD1 isoform X4 [Carcharodon carcharias]|uniref:uncharacterized protein NKAPD1 isoform X4 n=1 Tax=Carcharodon carcharias TaxID=13397 RepID=UPI001B7E819B|nr:uncharacterized protein NKAPD1 isoform X4 [Carcharodon carcharias]
MARIPMGKVLLRNVIRHTDAHNKIQEESEMWKIREKEKQTNEMRFFQRRRKSVNLPGNRMRCDGYDEEEEERKANAAARKPLPTPQDERETRYWTKKLYHFEASDPNRWGHSGYKELYPEEFESERSLQSFQRGHKTIISAVAEQDDMNTLYTPPTLLGWRDLLQGGNNL